MKYKLLFLLIKMQVKSIINLFFMFSKKRFFFMQSIKKFNCFNPFIGNKIFLSVLNRSRFFFTVRTKGFFSSFLEKDLTVRQSFSHNFFLKRKRFDIYLSQLFYVFFQNQRFFSVLAFGILPRYARYTRIIKISKVLLLLRSVLLRFVRSDHAFVKFKCSLVRIYLDARISPNKKFYRLKLLLYYARILRRSREFLDGRFDFFKSFLSFTRVRLGYGNLKNIFDLKTITLVKKYKYSLRRRLFFFSGKTYTLLLINAMFLLRSFELIISFFFIYVNTPFLYIFLSATGYWFFVYRYELVALFVFRDAGVLSAFRNIKIESFTRGVILSNWRKY